MKAAVLRRVLSLFRSWAVRLGLPWRWRASRKAVFAGNVVLGALEDFFYAAAFDGGIEACVPKGLDKLGGLLLQAV